MPAGPRPAPSASTPSGGGAAIRDREREINERKASLRAAARETREALASGLAAAAAAGLAARFMASPPLAAQARAGRVVAGYMPIRSELDPRVLMARIAAAGAELCLPDVPDAEGPLEFRRWRGGERLEAGAYGIPAPPRDAEPLVPDLVLVPMLAFDRTGHRLGYGGGHYDRTIARLRRDGAVVAVGLAFSGQVRDDLPVGAHDARLDWIVTESAARPTAP